MFSLLTALIGAGVGHRFVGRPYDTVILAPSFNVFRKGRGASLWAASKADSVRYAIW